MKRPVLVLVFLLLAGGVRASGGNVHYEASGTSDFTITFKSMAQGFAVLASSNPITVIAKVGTTAVDTMTVEAGNSMFFYCPANNLAINRTLATAVTINPTFNNSIIPNLGSSSVKLQTALDSIATAVYAPTPVTFSDPITLWDVTRFNTAAQMAKTLPVIGENVTGATSLLFVADWSDLTGQFSIQICVGPTGGEADTFLTYPIDSGMYYPTRVYTRWGADSTYTSTVTNTYIGSSPTQNFWRIDSATVKQHATEEGFVFRVTNNGHPFLGYVRARVICDTADSMHNFRLVVIKEY